jgi:hypothetical protein
MGAENIEENSVTRADPGQLQEYLEREADALNGVSADELLLVWQELFCAADRRAGDGRVRRAHDATARALARIRHLGMVR